MELTPFFFLASALAPAVLMLAAVLLLQLGTGSESQLWTRFKRLSGVALCGALMTLVLYQTVPSIPATVSSMQALSWLGVSALGVWLALLVQLLGTVIAVFSARYLQGEPRQKRYLTALAGVLAAVHVLVLANHWVVLIAAWAAVGLALQHLLCFYPDRPFALLAAHKKRKESTWSPPATLT